jgi:hypothetical protein
MIAVLLDHHLDGYVLHLTGAISAAGLEGLLDVRLVTFAEVGLPTDSSDRAVWRFAQARGMVILTGNRNEDDDTSLGRTLQQENTPQALPVLTIGRIGRLGEPGYRTRCAVRLLEILLDVDLYRGAGRIYIP